MCGQAESARRRPLRPAELHFIAAIEGRPAEALRATAGRLGISTGTVWRRLKIFRERGVLRLVTLLDHSYWGGSVESLAQVRVDWSKPDAADLERVIRDDPAITEAALTVGRFDFTIWAVHADHYAAADWARALQGRPCVDWCDVKRVKTRFKRFSYAAALLNRIGCDGGRAPGARPSACAPPLIGSDALRPPPRWRDEDGPDRSR